MSDKLGSEQLKTFLNLVPNARWGRSVPNVWSVQLRQSLNDGLVGVGFGGVLVLTDAGYAALNSADQ